MPNTKERSESVQAKSVTLPIEPDSVDVGVFRFNTEPYVRFFEKYTPNSDRGGKKRRVRVDKPFQHYKRVVYRLDGAAERLVDLPIQDGFQGLPHATRWELDLVRGFDINRINHAPSFGGIGDLNVGLPVFLASSEPGEDFVLPPENLGDLVLRSMRTLVPLIKSELSLVNSVIELKDFLTVKPTVERILKTIGAVVKNDRGLRGIPLRHILQSSADGYLQAQFNFLPLISDVKSVMTSILQSSNRARQFLLQEGRASKRHFVFKWEEHPAERRDDVINAANFVDSFLGLSNTVWGYADSARICRTRSAEFHASLKYITTYSGFQRDNFRVLALADSLGLDFNPVIIWNAIPWSFVVDWLVNVNGFLSSMRAGFMDPLIHILGYEWSIKRKRSIWLNSFAEYVYRFEATPPAGTGALIEHIRYAHTSPQIDETAYRRDVFIPDSDLMTTSGLSLTEFSLAVALATKPVGDLIGRNRLRRKLRHRLERRITRFKKKEAERLKRWK